MVVDIPWACGAQDLGSIPSWGTRLASSHFALNAHSITLAQISGIRTGTPLQIHTKESGKVLSHLLFQFFNADFPNFRNFFVCEFHILRDISLLILNR